MCGCEIRSGRKRQACDFHNVFGCQEGSGVCECAIVLRMKVDRLVLLITQWINKGILEMPIQSYAI